MNFQLQKKSKKFLNNWAEILQAFVKQALGPITI